VRYTSGQEPQLHYPFISAAARALKLSPELYMKEKYEFKYK
jgi:hypothetical protein